MLNVAIDTSLAFCVLNCTNLFDWLCCWCARVTTDIVYVFVCLYIFVSWYFLWYCCFVLNTICSFLCSCLSQCGSVCPSLASSLSLWMCLYVFPSGVCVCLYSICGFVWINLWSSLYFLSVSYIYVFLCIWLSLCWFLSPMFHVSLSLCICVALLLWPHCVLLLCMTHLLLLLFLLLLLLTSGWHFRHAASEELGLPRSAGMLNPAQPIQNVSTAFTALLWTLTLL